MRTYEMYGDTMDTENKPFWFQRIARVCQTVFDALGTGHAEAVYHRAVVIEMLRRPSTFARVESERAVPIFYGDTLVSTCRADLVFVDVLTQRTVLMEIKAHAGSAQHHLPFRIQLCKYVRHLAENQTAVHHAVIANFRQPKSESCLRASSRPVVELVVLQHDDDNHEEDEVNV